MNQIGKRSLRERRAPKAFDSDNQSNDPYGYNRPPYHKETKTPSQMLNIDAKLLVKFINSSNKSAKQLDAEHRKKEMENIKEPVAVRGGKIKQGDHGETKKKQESREIRLEPSRRGKELQPTRGPIPSNSDNRPNQKNESFLNKIKNIAMESATNMRKLELNARSKHEGKQREKKEENMKKISEPASFLHVGSKGDNTRDPGVFSKDKEKMKKIHEVQDRLGIQRSDFSNKNKIFKRSAYHVAIAYHIYLKKIGERGQGTAEIDPTYHARKLKEGMTNHP